VFRAAGGVGGGVRAPAVGLAASIVVVRFAFGGRLLRLL